MRNFFFETDHNASADYPYFSNDSKNLNFLSHFHKEIELAYVQYGRADIVCEGAAFTASEGNLCIFMPGEIHSFSAPCENDVIIIKLHCGHSVEKVDFSAMRMVQNPIDAHCALYTELCGCIRKMSDEFGATAPGYAYMANSISNEMVCRILRSGALRKIDPEQKKSHLSAITVLERVSALVESRYDEPISLTEAAQHCNLSKYYFSHFFKQITGTTFLEYLTMFRLEKSLPLLSFTEKKMSEIAHDCGFSNIRSFNRAFKSIYQKTPSEYRAETLYDANQENHSEV